ncbi:hypothetical protein QYF61_011877 [Mycteria americana]|uniref:Uncharacterized protein n=1 Tax=Mycteria americana TaxID=33587 RepID=A0AAN7NCJ8_MYCAM|nr:hypothetical protein QYF61_011877 [Mycteria americana]
MLGAPELNAVLQPKIRLTFWAASTHCWLTSSFLSISTPKSFSSGLLSIHCPPSLYLCLGLPRPRCKDLALGLVELHEAYLKPVKAPLDGIPSLQHINCTTQLDVVDKLAEGALNPTIHVANKDVKQCQSQCQPLRNTSLVTGATDGIGKAYAEELARRGMKVALISRSKEKLDQVASEIKEKYKVETKVIVADFGEREDIYSRIKVGLEGLEIGVLGLIWSGSAANGERFCRHGGDWENSLLR